MTAVFATQSPVRVRPPKRLKEEQWEGYRNPPWLKKDKKKVTILYNFVERRKSYFMRAYFERHGFRYRDLGDHVKEDVRWGKEYGNRMECNPMYFTSGSLIRNLFKLHREEGFSKKEVVENFVFVGGGGQCGPCRYGMYPQEYFKVVNDAGFKDFRLFLFSSDMNDPLPKDSAFAFNLLFRINFVFAFVLADFMHIAECALRPYAKDKKRALAAIAEAEEILLKAFRSRLFLITLPLALRKAGRMFAALPRRDRKLPFIYMTGEIFANLAHNDGNYNLRRFIMDEDCEVAPGLFTNRALYEFWRRGAEAKRRIEYASSRREERFWKKSLRKQRLSSWIVLHAYRWLCRFLKPASFGGKAGLHDLDELAMIGYEYYHPEIFGGEGNLEVAEALHYADTVDGFISSKPFGCMPSSGVSDGVQAKIMSLKPQLNFLSIETSGDNEVSILSRVSMLLFKAKQKVRLAIDGSSDSSS
ncbi:MAG: hypothetical protein GF418_05125 [Chitinivibrionales bacterium]|nr:hypothetical protein [Chitinivibrionales bacterium]MBD3394992.1 hypothetical protein [Chitinivibrionales bacterium]